MAGDWIKMRVDLFTHPKVVRISSALKADRLRTVGGLMSAWCLFDAHSIDGHLRGYTLGTLDDLIGWPGFSAELHAVGWVEIYDDGLLLPRFDAHNGASAKRRAMDADRKKEVRKTSASDADKMRTREEKRREEKKEHKALAQQTARFDEFWSAYPVKKGRAEAEAKWKARGLDKIADRILADVAARKSGDRQWLDGYAPHGSTYVNGRGWEDSIEAPRGSGAADIPDFMLGAI